jgi:hypothetical protein
MAPMFCKAGVLNLLNRALTIFWVIKLVINRRQEIWQWIRANPYKFAAIVAIIVAVPLFYNKKLVEKVLGNH